MLPEDEVVAPKDSQSAFEEHLAMETQVYNSRLALDRACQQVGASGSGSSKTPIQVIELEDTPATSEVSVEAPVISNTNILANNLLHLKERLKAYEGGMRGVADYSSMCELCGFKPKTKNKYRERQDHLYMKHFKKEFDLIMPHVSPWICPEVNCDYSGKDKQSVLRHFMGKHGILEKFLSKALAKSTQPSHETTPAPEHPVVLLVEDTASS